MTEWSSKQMNKRWVHSRVREWVDWQSRKNRPRDRMYRCKMCEYESAIMTTSKWTRSEFIQGWVNEWTDSHRWTDKGTECMDAKCASMRVQSWCCEYESAIVMFFSFPPSFRFLACIKYNINRQHGGQLGNRMVYLATMLKLFYWTQ